MERKPDLGPSGQLLDQVQQRIRDAGPMLFSEFMQLALYQPGSGYYTSGRSPWGDAGDYLTAPQVHAASGICLARLASEIDAALERPDPFSLVEMGSGDGRLLAAVVATLQADYPETYSRLRVVSAEAGEVSRRQQQERVEVPPRGLTWFPDAMGLTPDLRIEGLAYSNELLDALPVERLTVRDGRLLQCVVALEGEQLVQRFGPAATGSVFEYLRDNQVVLREGQVAEVCLQVADWVKSVAAAFERGALVTIDYGHETSALYGASRPAGTLVCQHRFELTDDPLVRLGRQDITAHVDFGNLRRVGRAHGLDDGELCSLRVFLIGLGATERPSDDIRAQLALRHLLVSEIADTHKVLLQTKGIAAEAVKFGRARLDC